MKMTQSEKYYFGTVGLFVLLAILVLIIKANTPGHLVVVQKSPETVQWDRTSLKPYVPVYKISSEITY